MDLVVELLVGLSWPVTFLVIAIMFRREAVALLARVTRVRYKELEADFESTIRDLSSHPRSKLEELAKAALPPGWVTRREKELLDLANVSPRVAILEAWLEVEHAIRDLAHRYEVRETSTPDVQAQELAKRGIVPAEFPNSINELRRLRNSAVHSVEFDLPAELVRNYVKYSFSVIDVLEAIKESKRGKQSTS